MWLSFGVSRILRILKTNGLPTVKSITFTPNRLSSSSPPDLQSLFVNPRIHNLLHKLVSVAQPTKIHEPKFKVEKVHDIKLLSDSELQAVSIKVLQLLCKLGYALYRNVNFPKIANAPSDERKTS